jgi:hypothetical protein
MGTVRADGAASLAPCWYRYGDRRLYLSMGSAAERLKNLRRDSRASFGILVNATPPYAHVWLGGRAVEVSEDADLRALDERPYIYVGEPNFRPHGDRRRRHSRDRQLERVGLSPHDGDASWSRASMRVLLGRPSHLGGMFSGMLGRAHATTVV